MAITAPARVRAPRLNPFAFPSDTDFRFALLIASVLGSSVYIYGWLYFNFTAYADLYLDTVIRCQEAYEVAKPTDPLADREAFLAANDALSKCMASIHLIRAGWIIGGMALLLIVAGVIYWAFPAWKIRRSQLVPLTPNDAPEVVAHLVDLCREAGLSSPPIFLWNPLNPASSGLAFGRLGRYYVALTGGLVTQFYTDRPAFRAVALHELAHLRNADVDKTYFTVAIWQAFVVVALVPFAVSLFDNAWNDIFNISWRALALVTLVYLTRNAVLRAREVYADVRASGWDGPTGALGRMLATLPQPKGGRWRGVLRVHPNPNERRRALDDTDRLFRMGFWEALGTGIAATVALPNVTELLSSFMAADAASLWAGLIFAPLAVGIVGLGAWRATFAAVVRGETPPGTGQLGLGLGLGVLLGDSLSFLGYIDTQLYEPSSLIDAIPLFLFNILWSGLLLASLFFFLRWIVAGASIWLEMAVTSRSPRLAYGIGLTIASGLLALWFGLLFLSRDLGVTTLSTLGSDPVLLILALSSIPIAIWVGVQNPLVLLAFMSLWAFPLAAWFWRRRAASTSDSSWAFLDSSSLPLTLPRQAPLRPGLGLIIGLVGGLIFCGLLLMLRFGVRLSVPEVTRSSDQFKLAFYNGQVALAVLMQAGTAAVVAGWVKRLGGPHGLFAAFVAGCVMTVGILGLGLLFGGRIILEVVWNVFSQVVNGGALLALPVAWGISTLTERMHHSMGRIEPSQP